MFTTHKTDAPPSHGDSSVDSSGNGSFSPPTNSNHWTPLCSEDSIRGPMRSPDLDRRAPHSKRNSLLNLRSRSNTATSMSSLTSMNSLNHNQYEAPRSESPLPIGQLHSEASTSRKSLFRGKLGKRLSESPFSHQDQLEGSESQSIGKRTSVLRKAMRRDPQVEASFREMKHRISSPFDFQHLTHTDREQYATLQKSPEFDLAEDFQAVRASHLPSNRLTGIKANDLHFNNFSSENLSITDLRSKSVADADPSPMSPTGWQQAEVGPEPASPRPNLRLTRSVESFSQPGVKHRGHGHSQSIIGPPRTSSLSKVIDEGDKFSSTARGGLPRRDRAKRESGIWGSLSLASHELEPVPSYFDGATADVGHALTTPNDLAIQAVTPPFSPGLEDVAEEPEMFTHPRAAPQPPVKTPTSPRSPMFDPNFSMHYSPTSRSRSRGNSHSLSQRNMHSRPASQMSDTLRSSGLIRRESIRRRSPRRRQSNTWRAPQESWEDSVDFIYENALEADCDFEWDRASNDGSLNEEDSDLKKNKDTDFSSTLRGPRITRADSDAAFPSSAPPFTQDFRASLLVPSSVPDLEPTSATSASTMETALATPSEIYSIPRRSSNQSSINQALLVSHDYKDNRDTYYDDLLNQYDDSDPHFTLLDPEYSTTSSARSSRVRSSRRSSYDSSFMSSAQSSGLWSSPVRRSASSAGSVPDLVPSRRTRRDFSFSLMIDQLSDSVASLNNLDEEKESDNDITPPGRSPDDRTMLPIGDKAEEVSSRSEPKALENELRVQLELARRGSQRNDSSPIDNETKISFAHTESSVQLPPRKSTQHKQALSDGAAKLLASGPGSQSDSQPKTRSRAATTTVRSPMLSLFPSPPRNSPTPNRM